MFNIELKSEDVDVFVKNALMESMIGKKLSEAINKEITEALTNWNSPVKQIVGTALRDAVLIHLKTEAVQKQLQIKIAEHLTEKNLDAALSHAITVFNEKNSGDLWMRILVLDCETTGLDFDKDRITELAWVIKDFGAKKPLRVRSHYLWAEDYPEIPDFITQMTGISTPLIKDHGVHPSFPIQQLRTDITHYKVEAIVGHNGIGFDKPMLLKCAERYQPMTEDVPDPIAGHWIDSQFDVVYPESFSSHRLVHLAAEYGFLNPFPHSAIFDVFTTTKILELQDIEKVYARSREPWVVLRAKTTYEQRDLAKRRRYRWETLGSKVYPKSWVKQVKLSDIAKERAEAPFDIEEVS